MAEIQVEVMESLEYKTGRFEGFSAFNKEPAGLSDQEQNEVITLMFWDIPARDGEGVSARPGSLGGSKAALSSYAACKTRLLWCNTLLELFIILRACALP